MRAKNNNTNTKELVETSQEYNKWLRQTGRLRQRPLHFVEDGHKKTRPPLKTYEEIVS